MAIPMGSSGLEQRQPGKFGGQGPVGPASVRIPESGVPFDAASGLAEAPASATVPPGVMDCLGLPSEQAVKISALISSAENEYRFVVQCISIRSFRSPTQLTNRFRYGSGGKLAGRSMSTELILS